MWYALGIMEHFRMEHCLDIVLEVLRQDLDFYDFYFYTKEYPQLIYNFYKKPQPEACKIGDVKYSLFGITFRRNDFKECCKLKRYLYPNDLRLEQPELIYGK